MLGRLTLITFHRVRTRGGLMAGVFAVETNQFSA